MARRLLSFQPYREIIEHMHALYRKRGGDRLMAPHILYSILPALIPARTKMNATRFPTESRSACTSLVRAVR